MKMNKPFDRRSFLKIMATGTCAAACHNVLAPGGMVAYALPPGGRVKRFVEIFMYGGCCSYGMFPQFNAGAQARYPTLFRNPSQAASIGHPDIGLHLAFAPLVAEANAGTPHLAVIVGTAGLGPNGLYSRSHQEAQDSNERITGDYRTGNALGIGAAIAQVINDPYALIAFDGASDFALGGAIPARSVSNLQDVGKPNVGQFYNMIEASAKAQAPQPATAETRYIVSAIQGMDQNIQTLQNLGQIQPAIAFPNTGIGNRLKDVTRMATARLGSVFMIPYGGFDTHSNQAQQHTNLFTQLNNALVPFIQNLKLIPGIEAATAWDETVILTRTDFSRTFENNAAGTDHGLTGNQLILGGAIRGGVFGDPPNAQKFQNETGSYAGPSWTQFNASQPTKEIVRLAMGLDVQFPDYVGNLYSPIGFLA